MKIKSIFKDYYDCGISYGIDENLTFIRKNFNLTDSHNEFQKKAIIEKYPNNLEEIECFFQFQKNFSKKYKNFYISREYRNIIKKNNKNYSVTYSYLSFCENLVPFIRVSKMVKHNVYEELEFEEFFYKLGDYKKFLDDFVEEPEKSYSNKNVGTVEDNVNKYFKAAENYFNNVKNTPNPYIELHKKFETPIIQIRNYQLNDEQYYKNTSNSIVNGIIINPSLKLVKFKNYLDPITCFQEVSMYMAYLKNPEQEVETIQMEDKVVQQSKGFDCMSFKKRGSKKKKC